MQASQWLKLKAEGDRHTTHSLAQKTLLQIILRNDKPCNTFILDILFSDDCVFNTNTGPNIQHIVGCLSEECDIF